MLIAFDIDGTLADLSHRLHWVKNLPANGKPDWEMFFAIVHEDKPIPEMVALCNTFLSCDDHTVIFVSGRSAVCREDTVKWLYTHLTSEHHYWIIDDDLYMRSQGDRRPDFMVKEDILAEIEHDYHQKPDLVFDDRQQVVDMWREHGIRVCQVAKGDF